MWNDSFGGIWLHHYGSHDGHDACNGDAYTQRHHILTHCTEGCGWGDPELFGGALRIHSLERVLRTTCSS